MGHHYHTPSFQGSGISVEERVIRLKEPGIADYKERMRFRPNRRVVHMNSHPWRYHAEDQMLKPDRISAWRRGEGHEISLLIMELLVIDSC